MYSTTKPVEGNPGRNLEKSVLLNLVHRHIMAYVNHVFPWHADVLHALRITPIPFGAINPYNGMTNPKWPITPRAWLMLVPKTYHRELELLAIA